MAGNLVDLTSGNFESTVAEGITLVDFWAPWCGPCRMLTPIVQKLADSMSDTATIAKCNVDDCSDVAMKYEVSNIPTIIIFKNGEEAERLVGVQREEALKEKINALI